MRQLLVPVVFVSVLATSVLVSSPAQAATLSVNCGSSGTISATDQTLTVNFTGCTNFNWIWLGGSGAMNIVFNPGAITSAPPAGAPSLSLSSFSAGSATSFTATFSGPTARTARFTLTDGASNSQVITFNATPTGGGGQSSDSEPSAEPAPIQQQFGKPSSGTCDAAAPATLNWSGVASTGWGESWAQWMNGGSGGAVCTRTLVYNTAQSRWIVS